MTDVFLPNNILRPCFDAIKQEVFRAERAWSIARATGERHVEVRAAEFGELFGTLQALLGDSMTLSVTKLLEKPSRRHRLHTVPVLIEVLREHSSILEIRDPASARRWLNKNGMQLSGQAQPSQTTLAIVEALQRMLPPSDNLRMRRDKNIAHAEAVSLNDLPTTYWRDLLDVIRYAKETLALIGRVYLGEILAPEIGHEGHFLSMDAEREGRALLRLLDAAGIGSPPLER